MITIDMEKARLIAKDYIRGKRMEPFEKLDVLYMRASEGDDRASMATVVEGKQYLRDITDDSRITTADTSGELLKAIKDIESEMRSTAC